MLYADDDIRIFTNRVDSPDRWESEGLVVVQVRDELSSRDARPDGADAGVDEIVEAC